MLGKSYFISKEKGSINIIIILSYHRSFIDASKEYLLEYLSNENKNDELLQNVIDYFTEKWNFKTKSFIYKTNKKNKLEELKINFAYHEELETIDGEKKIIFNATRETATQVLLHEGKYNKRKLNEFLYVIEKMKNEKLSFEIMKEHLYNKVNSQDNFFNVKQNYSFNEKLFSSHNNLKFILAASFYNHLKIIEWIVDENFNAIHDVNDNHKFSIHFGNMGDLLYEGK